MADEPKKVGGPRKALPLKQKVKAHLSGMTPEAMRRHMELHRKKIDTTKLITRVQKHAMGKLAMTPTQLSAATALLRKTLPDLVGTKVEVDSSPVIFNFNMTPKTKE